ncbi:hypothetical protein OFN56_28315, partial [Escherichia coli]|nr:hypothetical protein [Escherichia coli]
TWLRGSGRYSVGFGWIKTLVTRKYSYRVEDKIINQFTCLPLTWLNKMVYSQRDAPASLFYLSLRE